MKNAKRLVPVLAILLCVSLSCTFLKDQFSNLGVGDRGSVKVPNLPPFDPNGPMVSPGAYVMRLLAETEPAVAAMVDEVESAERKLMKQAIDTKAPKPPTDDPNRTSLTLPPQETESKSAMSRYTSAQRPVAAFFMLQSGELALPTDGDGAFFGGFTGYLKGMLAGAISENFNKKGSQTEAVEGGTSTMTYEMGLSPDGSTVFEMGMNTETEKNGVRVTSEFKSRIEGQDCPNAEGQVPITIKLRLAGQSGSSRYEQDVTAFVRLVVDDNADIASKTIDVTQATARGRSGRNVFVESGVTYQYAGGDSERTASNHRLIRSSDNATGTDVTEFAGSGNSVALGAAETAIGAAESAWKGGACIKIEANSPGTVELNSTTSIPVKVIHKKEGSELAAKLESKLEGAVSVDPPLIPRTPGTMTYLAPGDPGKSATIGLTASCRRGRAQLDLNADTGKKAYRVEGKSNGVSFKGFICNWPNYFDLDATFPGGTATVSFLNDRAGSTITRGGGGGCTMAGEGAYKLDIGDDDTGTLKWTTTDKLSCPGFGNSRTSTFSVAVIPAPDHYCR